jgi:hypothetical protein
MISFALLTLLELFTFISFFTFFAQNLIKFSIKNKINKKFLILLILVKIIFLVSIFFYGKAGYAVDAKSIYDMSSKFFYEIYTNFSLRVLYGSDFVSLLISPFTIIGQLSYFNLSILFLLLGLYSSLLFYVVLRKYSKNKYQDILCMIIVLYPTLNLFTSYITKDVLIYFLISYFLYIINFDTKNKYFVFKILLIATSLLLIRPYVFIVLSFSTLLTFILFYNFKKIQELFFSLAIILVFILIFSFLFNKIYIQVFTGNGNILEQIFNYLAERAKVTNTGSAQINLQNLSFLGKIYNVLFGPPTYNFSFTNIVYFIDKLYLFFILFHLLFIKIQPFKIESNRFRLFEISLLFFSMLLFLLISLSISNYGMALRLKLMFLPIFFYFIFKNQKVYSFKD